MRLAAVLVVFYAVFFALGWCCGDGYGERAALARLTLEQAAQRQRLIDGCHGGVAYRSLSSGTVLCFTAPGQLDTDATVY